MTGDPHPICTPEFLELLHDCGVAIKERAEIHEELTSLLDAPVSVTDEMWLQALQRVRESSARCRDAAEDLGQFIDDFAAKNDGSVIGHGGSLR